MLPVPHVKTAYYYTISNASIQNIFFRVDKHYYYFITRSKYVCMMYDRERNGKV